MTWGVSLAAGRDLEADLEVQSEEGQRNYSGGDQTILPTTPDQCRVIKVVTRHELYQAVARDVERAVEDYPDVWWQRGQAGIA